jgi:hypothetical protein
VFFVEKSIWLGSLFARRSKRNKEEEIVRRLSKSKEKKKRTNVSRGCVVGSEEEGLCVRVR